MNRLFVAWRSEGPAENGATGGWGPVGVLERTPAGGYRFAYTHGARTVAGFHPFPGMADLKAVYESDELFPMFSNRLMNSRRPEYKPSLVWSGFDPDNPPDPIALLGVTEGLRQTDSLEVFPCPAPDGNGCFVNKFFLHGVRYVPPAAIERIGRLSVGDPLVLMFDDFNKHDPMAVAVRTDDAEGRFMIGYVPRYLAYDVRLLCSNCHPDFIELRVERVNHTAPFQQRLLCRMNSCWPTNFEPCSGEAFQTIVPDAVSH
ncbi:MAG: DNA-binding protein [Planctomycetes bacterium]|nr:DNA-binding protein [Planctomycetota bacterium]